MTEPVNNLPEPEVFVGTATVGGRDMSVKTLTDAQFMTLTHEATLMQNPNVPTDRKLKSMDRAFRVLKSVVVEEDDMEYIQDEMAEGRITLKSLATALLSVHAQNKQAQGTQTKGPIKAARRGRSTKS